MYPWHVIASFCGLLIILEKAAGYRIYGKVSLPNESNKKWVNNFEILLDGGIYKGFLRVDGTFTVYDVPPGSYVVEVTSPKYSFEPVRVDVSPKGRVRARKVNHLNTTEIALEKYPLEMKSVNQTKYFEDRKKFGVIDMLKDPMVLMTIPPLIMFVMLFNMMNSDNPAVRKQLEQSFSMFNPAPSANPANQNKSPANFLNRLPAFDLAEFMAKFFSPRPKSSPPSKKNKKIVGKNNKRIFKRK